MISRLKNYFFIDVPSTSIPSSNSKQRERELVATFARGNPNLQLGRYTTAEDLERIKASLHDHRFVVTK